MKLKRFLFLLLIPSFIFAAPIASPSGNLGSSAHASTAQKAPQPVKKNKRKSKPAHHRALKKKPSVSQAHPSATHLSKTAHPHTKYSKKKHHVMPTATHSPELKNSMFLSQTLICKTAKSELGLPYQWGGDNPEDGFDCSGFSQYVFQQQGIHIPRTAAQQFQSLTPIRTADLQEGDLVFFKIHGRRISHVGIYIGHGEFIHSPRTGAEIRVDNLHEAYWHKRYAGARRAISWNYAASHFNHTNNLMTQLNVPSLS